MRIIASRPFWIGGHPVLLGQILDDANSVARIYIKLGDAERVKP